MKPVSRFAERIVRLSSAVLQMVPGVLFMLGVGLFSKYVGGFIPHISYLIICIAAGLLFGNLIPLPDRISVGITGTHKLWLETGIVILGARVVFEDLVRIGPTLLWMVFGFIFGTMMLVECLSRLFKLEPKLGSCLASGTSVCGVSAVIATGGAIEAEKRHIAFAVATVLLFDVITVFLYPVLGKLFAIPGEVFGPWTGISMFSTGTTVAAGFAHSESAGQIATVCKMARNAFIGIWALLYSLYYSGIGKTENVLHGKARFVWRKFPKPIIGFVLVMIFTNSGACSQVQVENIKNAYNWLFMLAFVGLGYTMSLRELKQIGIKPFLVVLPAFLFESGLSLTVSYAVFG